jgi:hypothetical protein
MAMVSPPGKTASPDGALTKPQGLATASHGAAAHAPDVAFSAQATSTDLPQVVEVTQPGDVA